MAGSFVRSSFVRSLSTVDVLLLLLLRWLPLTLLLPLSILPEGVISARLLLVWVLAGVRPGRSGPSSRVSLLSLLLLLLLRRPRCRWQS